MWKGTRIGACVTWFSVQTALESSVNHTCKTLLCLGPRLLHSLKLWTGSCAGGKMQNPEQISADLQVGPFLDRHTGCGLGVCPNYILKIKQQKYSERVPFKVKNFRKKGELESTKLLFFGASTEPRKGLWQCFITITKSG